MPRIRHSPLLLLLLLLLAGCATSTKQTAPITTATIPMGDKERLTTLYSYPNNTSQETLTQTITHYLQQRIERDGIPNGSVSVTIKGGQYIATITGESESVKAYPQQLENFLTSGSKAATAVADLKQAGLWNSKEWRFFLPLGLALVNQRSVQLLHFPPDYSLTEQDYLNSKTSQRWELLLKLNGVSPTDVDLYETILDIAPIAAPASAGSTLSDTYTYFEPYILSMLPLLLTIEEGSPQALPIVAYGSPVRDWVKTQYGLTTFKVNTATTIAIGGKASAPILGANHPSYIWYVAKQSRKQGLQVMSEDLISACWQARMQKGGSGSATINKCTDFWKSQPKVICEQLEIQAYNKTPEQAKAICSQ